jgi:three-Cys-motif partner protein
LKDVKFDEIGSWSEIKLEIIQKYVSAYSTVMHKQTFIKEYYYIDAFSGSGIHILKDKKRIISGSPINALKINPPFSRYHFIDLDGDKIEMLKALIKEHSNVNTYKGDCNKILLEKIFPTIKFTGYNRALCLLDPYGLHLNWKVIYAAGKSRVIEIFLNFPVMDMNMNVLWNIPEKVEQNQIERMDAFWGDSSWKEIAYNKEQGLFGTIPVKNPIEIIADAFRKRLKEVAGFGYVPEPMPMRNTRGGIVYYLFFASPNKTGAKIVKDIFNRYRDKGVL